MNAKVGLLIPDPDQMNWELRTVLVVMLDFLVPATVLGMVGPVVAKMAVEQAAKAGSAIGDVYFWGAIGSIAGTFLCGFVLMYLAPTSTIVILVAAALALLAAAPDRRTARPGHRACSPRSCSAWARSARSSIAGWVGAVDLGLVPVQLPGAGRQCRGRSSWQSWRLIELVQAWRADDACVAGPTDEIRTRATRRRSARPSLTDLAVLAFVASLAFMALEMVAGRLVHAPPRARASTAGRASSASCSAGLSLRQLPGRQDRRLHQEREAGELALPGGLGSDFEHPAAGDAAEMVRGEFLGTGASRS